MYIINYSTMWEHLFLDRFPMLRAINQALSEHADKRPSPPTPKPKPDIDLDVDNDLDDNRYDIDDTR